MQILKETWRLRRDFYATMYCGHCGAVEHDMSCYDDSYFHSSVIPAMVCKSCGKKEPQNSKAKYDDSVVI